MTHSKASFKELKSDTAATSGNISVQLKKLEEAGYLRIEKSFLDNYPNTQISMTDQGLKAFEDYIKHLKKYL
jgi:DNA-binding MarR family transcriptional regulator